MRMPFSAVSPPEGGCEGICGFGAGPCPVQRLAMKLKTFMVSVSGVQLVIVRKLNNGLAGDTYMTLLSRQEVFQDNGGSQCTIQQ